MSRASQRSIAFLTAVAAGAVVVVCAAILFTDDLLARRRAPQDDRRIAALQEKVRNDAAEAPKLEAEWKRITAERRARKTRINGLSLVLIAAAAAFLISAKRLPAFQSASPAAGSRLVQVTAAPGAPALKAAAAARAPTPIDLAFVDEIVAKEGRGREAAIPILQAIQAHYRYLPDEALQRVCALTEITPAQIAGTSSFYAQFRRTPVGKHVVRVCHGTACHVSGARQITDELRRSLGIPEGSDTDAERMFTIDEVACVGCCSLAPVLMVDGHTVGKLTPASAREALDTVEPREPA
jgi:NADH:ubiquinone oxidoreductase subunit E